MERKTFYESPLIQEMSLDLEQVLCASVTVNSNAFGITALDEVDTKFDWE